MNDVSKKLVKDEDLELIEKFKSGDRKSFNLLVLKYQKMVYNVSRKILINHDDADEITQNVFINLYKKINQFRGESKLSTYLYRISVNLSLNYLYNKNKNLKKINDGVDVEEYSDNNNALKRIEFDEETNIIRKSIESLPPQQRAVFILRFYENLSYEEISEILGTSIGGLKANYFHAIKNLKSFYKLNNIKD